jgi:multidrug efflux pump subunit AcrB
MNISRLAIFNPVAVTAAILLVVLMGAVGLSNLPIQMIPDAQRPFINITTGWRSAAPQEIESAIIEPQEDQLRGVPGLIKMTSSASRGNGSINLSFTVETDLQRALIEVMNRLNQVPRYPPDVTEPRIFAGQDSYGNAIAWFAITTAPGNDRDIVSYNDFIKEVVQSRIERVPGVSNSNSFGGRPEEVRITFDPFAAAALNIDIPTMAGLTGNNDDTSGGYNDVGRRQYSLRYAGKYDLDEFGNMVLDWRGGNPVRLRDIATVEIKLRDESGGLLADGVPAIAFNALVEKDVNVLEVMKDLQDAVAELQDGPLQRAGLLVRQSYDESTYITNSIAMLRTNLLLGIALAIGVLWWFLRRFRATLMVALAIPICLFTAFFVLQMSGRSLNMISLAGLAFAMGMVLDGAIVVLENTIRLREHGMPPEEAAEKGASQVWGALLASTATTVAIFMPILFLKDLSAKLFADLALAISVAVVASLIIAVTVIPTATANWLRRGRAEDLHADWWKKITASIMKLTDGVWRRRSLVAGLFVTATVLTVTLLPQADYLPKGKDTWIFAYILMPPGQSVSSAKEDFQEVVSARLHPYLEEGVENQVDAYFFGTFGSYGFLGTMVTDPDDADSFIDLLNGELLAGFPDTMAFADRAGIFERLGEGAGIQMNIQSRDMDSMFVAAKAGMRAIGEAMPGAQARPEPGVELAEPELRLIPNERRITEAGWTRRQMSTVVRALGDGVYVGDYFDGDVRRDIVLRATDWTSPEQLAATPLATPDGGIQPVGQLVRMIRTAGPNEIRRVDRRRTITLNVTPPRDMSLEETVSVLQQQVEPVILRNLPADGEVSYFGSANDLKIALSNMSNSFTLAILILYLLVSALFRSFKDGALVLLALPLATVGGVMLLRIVNVPMDLLTMVGFITLLGLVVNNAILLVHQTRTAEREGIGRKDAVEQAIRRRLRPILMSTLTSLFGMLPLLLIPGPGSEVYKGLAAVIVGGMAVSTVFTLVFLPSLLRMGESSEVSQIAAGEPSPEPLSG